MTKSNSICDSHFKSFQKNVKTDNVSHKISMDKKQQMGNGRPIDSQEAPTVINQVSKLC